MDNIKIPCMQKIMQKLWQKYGLPVHMQSFKHDFVIKHGIKSMDRSSDRIFILDRKDSIKRLVWHAQSCIWG